MPARESEVPAALLQEQLCFALYAASRAVTAHYRPMLDALGLTYPQYLVLLALWEHGELSVKRLGELLELDSGTLSPLLKRLEQRGVIARARSSRDERSVTVAVTGDGEALRRRASCVPPAIQAAMGVDDDELADLRTRVRALADAVRQAAPAALPAAD